METLDMKLNIDYGQSKISKEVDGIQLLRAYEGWTLDEMNSRVLTNEDFKKIKLLKMREKAKKADNNIDLDLKDYGLEVVDKRLSKSYKEDGK